VSDEIPIAPLIYDGLDPAPKPKPVVSEVIEVLEETARHVKRSFGAARRPGMPLSVLSNIAREAPLGSLLGSGALLVQLISLSAYQPSLKQIELAAAVHWPSDELEAGDLPLGLSVGPGRYDCRANRRFIVRYAAGE
jgi:hypothetical protein